MMDDRGSRNESEQWHGRLANNSLSYHHLPCFSNSSKWTLNCSHALSTVSPEVTSLKRVLHGEIWTPPVIQRFVMLVILMILTLFGNIIIIIVLNCSKYKKLNRRVNIFIVNLAIGDLTVCCFTMTTEILFVVFEGAWILGAVACKVLLYIQMITLASTTFILTAMSFDRYQAICKPLSFGNTISRARKMIAISWILAFIFASPQLLIFKENAVGIYPDGEIKYKCRSNGYTAWWQRKLYFTFMTSYILVIPAILICFCYFNVVKVVWRQGRDTTRDSGVSLRRTIRDNKAIPRAKVKTIKMTLSIICSFIMCWTPYFVVHLIHIWSEYTAQIPEEVYAFAETIALLNSVLNPILYGCFNIKLKRGLLEVFCPNKVKLRERQQYRDMATGVTECMSVADNNACVDMAKHISGRCVREASSSSHSCQSHHSYSSTEKDGRTRTSSKDNIITEENVNGIKLRVRFTNGGSRSPLSQSINGINSPLEDEAKTLMTTNT